MSSPIRVLGLALRYLSPLLVIALGAFVAQRLIASRKDPPRSERPARVLPVEVVRAEVKDHGATLPAFGTVEALRTLSVRPMVGGPVIATHPALLAGGRVGEGETLLEIDPRDYELAVTTAEAALAAARADLEVERGTAAVAAKEWELLSRSFEADEESKSLALREPYVRRRESDVRSAEARLAQARLDLERTRVVAPFDAVVVAESVEVGTVITQGAEVATLVDSRVFVVEVSVPQDRLGALSPAGAAALVHLDGGGAPREGRVAGLLGEVDRAGRMARMRIELDDPLDAGDGGAAALLGGYARVELPMRPLPGAVAVPRVALREGGVVWLVDEAERLAIRPVEVGLRREEDVLITSGLSGGELVVTSPISVPVPGMALAPIEPGAAAAGAADGTRDPGAGQ